MKDINVFIHKFREELEDQNVEVTEKSNFSEEEYWDSLTAMVIKVMIEDSYGVDLEPEKISSFKTIKELFDHVTSLR